MRRKNLGFLTNPYTIKGKRGTFERERGEPVQEGEKVFPFSPRERGEKLKTIEGVMSRVWRRRKKVVLAGKGGARENLEKEKACTRSQLSPSWRGMIFEMNDRTRKKKKDRSCAS